VTVPVEIFLHGRIPRQLKNPARAPERVNAVTGESEAGVAERLVQDREVVAGGGDTFAEVLRWSCAEFDLAAWLQGQEAGSGQCARPFEIVQNFTNPAKWNGKRRI
jgi:hypothetical protein